MKQDPEDLRKLENDLRNAGQTFAEILKHHPDIAIDLVKLRDKTWKRFEQIAERGKGLDGDMRP